MSSAPYVTPTQLTASYPLGVSWQTIGKTASTDPSPQQNMAALASVCRLASNEVDSELGQTTRTLFVAEAERGPSHRIGFLPGSGMARMMTNWHPIRKVIQGAFAPTGQFPKTFTVMQPGTIFAEQQPQGFYGTTTPDPYHGGDNSLLISGAYVNWCWGRNGTEVWATYLNGWPHAAMPAGSDADVTTLAVDDVTGMAGAAPWITDSTYTEQVYVIEATPADPAGWSATVTYPAGVTVAYGGTAYQATIPSGPGTQFGPQTPPATGYWSTTIEPAGPGTLTLAAPTLFAHDAGTVITAQPEDILWAAALYAKAQALQRGLATLTRQGPGGSGPSQSTDEAIAAAISEAVARLSPFRRIL